MNPIVVNVVGEPKGQPRPRAFARRMGNKFTARVYDAGTAEGWKSCIAEAVRPQLPAQPIDGPVSLSLVFRMPRPKGHYGSGKNAEVLKTSAPIHHLSKPDADNLAKAVMDCLSRLMMWRDDTNVVELAVSKRYARADERPGMMMTICEIEGAALFAAK